MKKTGEKKNFLGIDFGTRYLGLAFSSGYLAEPLTTLQLTNLKEVIPKLIKIIKKRRINKVIVGLPEGRLERRIKLFTKELRKLTSVPVAFTDETLTTYEAKKKMTEAGSSRLRKKRKEHEIAACLILQEYLETQN